MAKKNGMIEVTLVELDGDARKMTVKIGTTIRQLDPSITTGNNMVCHKEVGNGWGRADLDATLRDGDEVMLQKPDGKFLS